MKKKLIFELGYTVHLLVQLNSIMIIYIENSLLNNKIELEVDLIDTIADVKGKYEDKTNIPAHYVRFIAKGTGLGNDHDLNSYEFKNGDTIEMRLTAEGEDYVTKFIL